MQSEFAHSGFKIYRIPDDIAARLGSFFNETIRIKFAANDCLRNYIPQGVDDETVRKLNAKHIYYRQAPKAGRIALSEYMRTIASDVEQQLGRRWKIVNVRAWTTLPGDDFGPTGWHVDGEPLFGTKFMLYPSPMNASNGTLEVYDRQGQLHTLKTDYPACVLFDNAVLMHRGRPGRTPRRAIEVQTMPSFFNRVGYIYAGQNARMPRPYLDRVKGYIPLSIKQTIKNALKPKAKAKPVPQSFSYAEHLNIGGGASYAHRNWINLDICAAPSFKLTPTCTFPLRSESIRTVYSSHCLEHLDDATVTRVLEESRRVIRKDGRLVIVIPDFEKVLERWRANDAEFFKIWGIDSIAYTWPRKNVPDNLDTRASFIFCGWMNRAWGNHFGDNIRRDEAAAYHGPAKFTGQILQKLLSRSSPHEIAELLVGKVRVEKDYTFNHQNAWSRKEFCALLEQAGFRVVSTDAKTIISNNPDIPDIGAAVNISAYYEAVLK